VLGSWLTLDGSYAGSGLTVGLLSDNITSGTGVNQGVSGSTVSDSIGRNIGVLGDAYSGLHNEGVVGTVALSNNNSNSKNVGILGCTHATGTGAVNMGGLFYIGAGHQLSSYTRPTVSSAISADNTNQSADIARFYDNSSIKVRVKDGGHVSTEAGVNVDVGGGLRTLPASTFVLDSDDEIINVSNTSYLRLDATGGGGAGARTFQLNQQAAGRILILELISSASVELLDDTSNSDAGDTRLATDWQPFQHGTLMLISNGTDWMEISRSNN
jgi:hypothetical protein